MTKYYVTQNTSHSLWNGALKKMLRRFEEKDEHSEYYRPRSHEIYIKFTKEDMLSQKFLTNALYDLRRTYENNETLNNVIVTYLNEKRIYCQKKKQVEGNRNCLIYDVSSNINAYICT